MYSVIAILRRRSDLSIGFLSSRHLTRIKACRVERLVAAVPRKDSRRFVGSISKQPVLQNYRFSAFSAAQLERDRDENFKYFLKTYIELIHINYKINTILILPSMIARGVCEKDSRLGRQDSRVTQREIGQIRTGRHCQGLPLRQPESLKAPS